MIGRIKSTMNKCRVCGLEQLISCNYNSSHMILTPPSKFMEVVLELSFKPDYIHGDKTYYSSKTPITSFRDVNSVLYLPGCFMNRSIYSVERRPRKPSRGLGKRVLEGYLFFRIFDVHSKRILRYICTN